jgi:hypothetical protein
MGVFIQCSPRMLCVKWHSPIRHCCGVLEKIKYKYSYHGNECTIIS